MTFEEPHISSFPFLPMKESINQSVLEEYGVCHYVATPYNPQSNGQAEVSKSQVMQILVTTVNIKRMNSSRNLDDAL